MSKYITENVEAASSCFLWSCCSDICLHTSNATVQTLLASNHPGRKCQWKGGCQMYHRLSLWWCLSLLCYFSMGSGEHHHFGSSKCLCSFRRGLYLGVCLALVGLVGRTSRRFLPSLSSNLFTQDRHTEKGGGQIGWFIHKFFIGRGGGGWGGWNTVTVSVVFLPRMSGGQPPEEVNLA